MLGQCGTVTVQRLVNMKIRPSLRSHRQLTRLHQAGAVWWRSSCRAACPVLTASPVRALVDERMCIKGRFLPPSSPVTVCARMHSEDGDLWEAFAHYHTHADGTIDLTRDGSVGGSYLGCEPMGLFWGMQPAPGGREGLKLYKKDVSAPYTVKVCVLDGHVCPSEAQSAELAAVTAERSYMAPGTRRIDIRQDGIVGTLFLPPGPGPFPAVLDLWGLSGVLVEYRSALLAARGYASFSLAYFRHKDLPGPKNSINIGDSYTKSAFLLLQEHPQVCADRVGIIALSFGVYLTFQLITHQAVKPSCLISINGPVGRSFKLSDEDGRPKAIVVNHKHWEYVDPRTIVFRMYSLPAHFDPEIKAQLKKISCPLMYIEGEDDLNASTKENAILLEETLREAGKSHLLTRLSYPGAGHLIEPPYAPNVKESLWMTKPEKLFILWGGGDTALHAAAQEHSWTKILEFLDNNLRR